MKTGLLAAWVLILCGCASSGTRIDTSQLSEVRKGQTTVAEVIKKFGRPTFLSKNWDGTQTAAYANPDGRSDEGTMLPLVGAVVAGGGSSVDSVIFYFDTRGVLTDFKTTQTAATKAEQAGTPEPVPMGSTDAARGAAPAQTAPPTQNTGAKQNAVPTQNAASTQKAAPAQNAATKPATAPRPSSGRSDGLPFWMPSEIRDPRNQ